MEFFEKIDSFFEKLYSPFAVKCDYCESENVELMDLFEGGKMGVYECQACKERFNMIMPQFSDPLMDRFGI